MGEWRRTRERLSRLERDARKAKATKATANAVVTGTITSDGIDIATTGACDTAETDRYRLHLYKVDALPADAARAQLKLVYRALRVNAPEKLRAAAASAASRAAAFPHLMSLVDAVERTLGAVRDGTDISPSDLDLGLFTKQASEMLAARTSELRTLRAAARQQVEWACALAKTLEGATDGAPVVPQTIPHVVARLVAEREDFLARSSEWMAAEDAVATYAVNTTTTTDSCSEKDATVVAAAQQQQQPNRLLLKTIHHFQLLFDVDTVSGVIPAMSAAHGRLRQLSNAQRHAATALGLPVDATCAHLVAAAEYAAKRLRVVDDELATLYRVMGVTTSTSASARAHIESEMGRLREYDAHVPVLERFVASLLGEMRKRAAAVSVNGEPIPSSPIAEELMAAAEAAVSRATSPQKPAPAEAEAATKAEAVSMFVSADTLIERQQQQPSNGIVMSLPLPEEEDSEEEGGLGVQLTAGTNVTATAAVKENTAAANSYPLTPNYATTSDAPRTVTTPSGSSFSIHHDGAEENSFATTSITTPLTPRSKSSRGKGATGLRQVTNAGQIQIL